MIYSFITLNFVVLSKRSLHERPLNEVPHSLNIVQRNTYTMLQINITIKCLHHRKQYIIGKVIFDLYVRIIEYFHSK